MRALVLARLAGRDGARRRRRIAGLDLVHGPRPAPGLRHPHRLDRRPDGHRPRAVVIRLAGPSVSAALAAEARCAGRGAGAARARGGGTRIPRLQRRPRAALRLALGCRSPSDRTERGGPPGRDRGSVFAPRLPAVSGSTARRKRARGPARPRLDRNTSRAVAATDRSGLVRLRGRGGLRRDPGAARRARTGHLLRSDHGRAALVPRRSDPLGGPARRARSAGHAVDSRGARLRPRRDRDAQRARSRDRRAALDRRRAGRQRCVGADIRRQRLAARPRGHGRRRPRRTGRSRLGGLRRDDGRAKVVRRQRRAGLVS